MAFMGHKSTKDGGLGRLVSPSFQKSATLSKTKGVKLVGYTLGRKKYVKVSRIFSELAQPLAYIDVFFVLSIDLSHIMSVH